jgi:Tol biopolymer transport system component
LVTHFVNWSPDSKHLIIVDRRVREEPTGLFVLSVETGEKRSLITPPAKSIGDSDPAFSPDGRTLAFLRSPSHTVYDLYLLALFEDLRPQGEPRRLTFDNGWIYGAAWTPDGHEIVFSSDRLNAPRLWRIVTSGLAQPQPLALVGDDAFAPAISRQGQRLAYAHARGDREIWQVRVPDSGEKASPPSKFIPSLFDHFSPQYSPDGKKVAFTSRRSGSCEIWVCEADGSNAMQLTSLGGPPSERANWSPDGKKIAFQSRPEGQAEIFVINSEGGRPKRLTYEPADDVAPSWSHDGRWIYFGSHRTGIDQVWKMPAEGGTPVQMTKNGGIAAVESPDGKFLYYTKVRGITGLWRMPVESGPETQVLESLLYLNFAVRPEGIYFSPATGPSSIWPSFQILSFPSGKVKTIVQGATLGLEVRTMTVAPNGRSILYSRPGPEHSVLMLVENFQ